MPKRLFFIYFLLLVCLLLLLEVPRVETLVVLLDDLPVLRFKPVVVLLALVGSGVASDFLVPLDVVLLDDLPNKKDFFLQVSFFYAFFFQGEIDEGGGKEGRRREKIRVIIPSSGSGVEVIESATEFVGEESLLLLVRVRFAGGKTGEVMDSSSRTEDID